MEKIKAKERFDFGNRVNVTEANIDIKTLEKMDRLVITPKEIFRNK